MNYLKQPTGFSIFFITEMWERYGFYVIQTLLVFYASGVLGLNDTKTYALVGSFTALAYINSIFGGVLADKIFGYNKTILLGALFLSLGYLFLAFSSDRNLFFLGLAIITVGTGLLKPNISSMLSLIYANNKNAKDIGYTFFYVGIYFGAISGSLFGGYIKTYFGWNIVFLSASLGLIFAFFVFYTGAKKYNLFDDRHLAIDFKSAAIGLLCIVLLIAFSFIVVNNDELSLYIFILIGVLSIAYLVKNIKNTDKNEQGKILAFAFLCLISVVYWAIYFQQFFSIGLCIARVTNTTMPESSLSSFESLGVIIFGPLVSLLYLFFAKRNIQMSIIIKFSVGFLLNSLAFCILLIGLNYSMQNKIMLHEIFVISAFLIIAFGELFITPVGLSMVSSLTPKKLHGAMMGIFLMSIGFGGKLAGYLALESSTFDKNIIDLQAIYFNSFLTYAVLSFAIFLFCLIIAKKLNSLVK